MQGNIRSDARKRKTDLDGYRYKCDACEEWFLSPHTWTEGKIVCPFCGAEVMGIRGK